MMLRLEALPARYGDCLWIEYGSGDNLRRILIDAGRQVFTAVSSNPACWN